MLKMAIEKRGKMVTKRAAAPDPLSLYPGEVDTESQCAPTMIGLSWGLPQYSPGIIPMKLVPLLEVMN